MRTHGGVCIIQPYLISPPQRTSWIFQSLEQAISSSASLSSVPTDSSASVLDSGCWPKESTLYIIGRCRVEICAEFKHSDSYSLDSDSFRDAHTSVHLPGISPMVVKDVMRDATSQQLTSESHATIIIGRVPMQLVQFGLIQRDPETVLVPPTTTRIQGQESGNSDRDQKDTPLWSAADTTVQGHDGHVVYTS